jgi:uncharacterized protein
MKQALQIVLRGYKRFVSPMLPHACRFVPTCSEYAMEAIERRGALRGSVLAARRLLRCHPFARAGYDPPPQQVQKRDLPGAPDPVPAAMSDAPASIQQDLRSFAGETMLRTLAASHRANARVGRQC